MYSEAMFLRKLIGNDLENRQVLSSRNNFDNFVVVCIPTPEFNVAWIRLARNISITYTNVA